MRVHAAICGPQGIQDRFGDKIAIVGVPSNDFNQEPGGADEIRATAHGKYGIAFPLAEKTNLRGADAHPFYRWARPSARSTCRAGISTNT